MNLTSKNTIELLKQDSYKKILKQASEQNQNVNIPNDKSFHSGAVYERMLLDTEKSFKVVGRGIKEEIFDRLEVLFALEKFLDRQNSHIELIIRARSSAEVYSALYSDFISTILSGVCQYKFNRKPLSDIEFNKFNDKCSITFIAEEKEGFWLDNIPSYSTSDAKAIRFRHLQKNNQYNENFNATVNFNNPDTVKSYDVDLEESLLNNLGYIILSTSQYVEKITGYKQVEESKSFLRNALSMGIAR